MSSRVDLPAPFGPTTPTACPRGTARLTPVSTFSAPNCWCTSRTASRASSVPVTAVSWSRAVPPRQRDLSDAVTGTEESIALFTTYRSYMNAGSLLFCHWPAKSSCTATFCTGPLVKS